MFARRTYRLIEHPINPWEKTKAATDVVVRTRNMFVFVGAPAFLTQGDCDETLVIRPN